MQFKVGDEVFIKAEITDVHEGLEKQYFVAPNYDRINWVSEDKIIPMDKTYVDGLNDAWELAKKILEMCGEKREEILGLGSYANILEFVAPEEALAKIEAYEREKEIKVGDVVKGISTDGIVTRLSHNDTFYVTWKDGSSGRYDINDVKKTGKHIDIESLLRQIGE